MSGDLTDKSARPPRGRPDRVILWRSPALVSNARNFVVHGDVIVAGYGFTQEPDFLFVIDKHTGQILHKKKVKSGPEFIFEKNGMLHVRTYDRDYVFELASK